MRSRGTRAVTAARPAPARESIGAWTPTLRLAQQPEAGELPGRSPPAALVGMPLDQPVPMEWAFAGAWDPGDMEPGVPSPARTPVPRPFFALAAPARPVPGAPPRTPLRKRRRG